MPHSPDNDHMLWQQLDQIYMRHILELKCGGANDTNCKAYQPNVEFLYTTRSQINDTFLFQRGVKVKVVGKVSEK